MNEQNNDIKRGLENLPQYEPKAELWDSIAANLEEDDKPKILYWRWITGIAATVAIMLSLNWVFTKSVDVPVVEVNTLQDPVNNDRKHTGKHDSQTIEVQNPVPIVPVKPGPPTVPTTGPYDGKAGLAMRDKKYAQSVQDQMGIDPTLNVVSDSIMTSSYNWNFGDGLSTQVTPAYSYSGTYNVNTNSGATYNYSSPDVTTLGFAGSVSKSTPTISNYNVKLSETKKTTNDNGYVVVDKNLKSVVVNSMDKKEVLSMSTRESVEVAAISIGRARSDANSYVLSENDDTKYVEVEKKRDSNTKDGFFKNESAIAKGDMKYDWSLQNYKEPVNTESYYPLIENDYEDPYKEPLSTFGIDVDNASYSIMRSKLNSNQVVPKDAVRVEEFINYFNYSYSQPTSDEPFSINLENAACPWNADHKLVRIGLKGKDIDYSRVQNSNLVFLIDVSGSMDSENKLPLVKKSMKLLVDQMGKNDRIAIVTYAGAAGLALESTTCDEKEYIKKKIDKLDAGGSTAGGEGIKLAYNIASQNLIVGGNNRVIMCTDGDFNVGQSSDSDMKQLIINNRNKGIFITSCGFGMGNYQDSKMETIADNGNGNYFYIDTYKESEKVFNTEMRATLFTIAKDVKIQVEFNPKHVKAYRLIGYENRKMPPQDFNDDTKDGGELGAGHSVTALYEIIPAGSPEEIPGNIELKYQKTPTTSAETYGDEMCTVKLRYKKPNGTTSMLLTKTMNVSSNSFQSASQDFQFAAGTALFAQQLRQSKYINQKDFTLARTIVLGSLGSDEHGYRQELLQLIDKASKTYSIYSRKE